MLIKDLNRVMVANKTNGKKSPLGQAFTSLTRDKLGGGLERKRVKRSK
ncbi:hypothetical protein HanHA300_Chr05g0159071 [Helianthus annuus]|nr:hypothetical protein HanHA300_Chr05g0159071 [Helianthus annuus]KAJ0583088.1 hypothetical protein HanHA89_Chr05g0172721 [Helianthus annuus]KAJ0748820.1 hypothetical protein HanLR1_Chr05g0162841 [Helianthus annuus]